MGDRLRAAVTRSSGPKRAAMAVAIAAGMLCGLAGCFNSGVTARTADLLGPGEVGGGGNFTIATYAPGKVILDDGDTASGNTGKRAIPHFLGWLVLHALNTQAWLRVGLPHRFEIGATLGVQQIGGKLRYALADEDTGAPVSLALGAAAMWRPWSQVGAPWFSWSLDLSRRFERRTSLVGLALTFGPEDHAVGLEDDQNAACGSFGEEGCSEYGPPRQFFLSRQELRLHMPIGVARSHDRNGVDFIFSMIPYVTLWTDPDRTVLTCEGCSFLNPVDFEEYWGIHFVFGVQFSG